MANVGAASSVATGSSLVAYASMAGFGAGCMSLTAVLILWARQVWPDGAGAGTSILFIALATGQALGTVGFDAAPGPGSSALLAVLAAALCTAGGLAGLGKSR